MTHPTPTLPLAETPLSPGEFEQVARMLKDHAGIRMKVGKEGLVRARLAKRLRVLGMRDFSAYLHYVARDATGAEFDEMIDALTTNKTNFLREPAHFDYLRDHVLPSMHASRAPVRIWSAGCSTGEEAYTLAMLLADLEFDPDRRKAGVFATDISQRVLGVARAATYNADVMADVPPMWLDRYWTRDHTPDGRERYAAAPLLRRLVHFEKLNLMAPWPMQGAFDAIFCRNVMIYFDKPTQQRLIERFWALLRPGGHLFVGHSESLAGLTHRFRYVRPAAYTR